MPGTWVSGNKTPVQATKDHAGSANPCLGRPEVRLLALDDSQAGTVTEVAGASRMSQAWS